MDLLLSLVGKLYKPEGRTPEEGFDCYGLVRWVLKENGFVELPVDRMKFLAARHYAEIIDYPTEVNRFDVLFCAMEAPVVDHLGIAISPADFIHGAHVFGAVVCEPICKYAYAGKIKAIGRVRCS